ncbi:hypothetical protein D1164_20540 [Mariniphaga sediminis]|uniref:Uncharacterized protein n=1 Tax=Mariniphaga sediminis TaxID=1628158 RepID=A0A399CVG4_9BACT|nr:oligosaccharide flippase family protein [Mariniphaga sediminis]RIH63243.1 hypothetical protein D1164_20540 [Mariniphaga sediminis]
MEDSIIIEKENKHSKHVLIFKNTFFLLSGEIVSQIIRLIFGIYIVRKFLPDDIGAYSVGMALGAMMIFFTDYGISKIVYIDVAQSKTPNKVVWTAGILRLLAIPIGAIIFITSTFILNYTTAESKTIIPFGLSVIVMSFNDIFFYSFKSTSKAIFITYSQLINALLTLIIIGSIILLELPFNLVAWLFLTKAIFIVSLNFFNATKLFPFYKPLKKDFSLVLKRSIPLGISAMAIIIYTSIDHVLISRITNVEMAGYYRAASQLAGLLAIIGTAFVSSVFPFLSSQNNDYESALAHSNILFRQSSRYLLALGVGIGLGFSFLSSKIVELIYGPNYSQSTPILIILVWTQVVIYMSIVAADNLLSRDLRKKVMIQTLLCLIIAFILYPISINFWGIKGAALSQLTIQLTALTYLYLQIRKIGINLRSFLLFDVPRIILSGLGLAFILYLTLSLNLFIQIFIGLISYALFLIVFKIITLKEIFLAKDAINSIIKK